MPADPPRRRQTRQEKQAETRRRLLDAAVQVFIERGFQAASVEEITAHAGYSRGAFYSNFDTKEQMFVELLHDRVYDGYRRMVERVPRDLSPAQRLRWSAQDLKDRYGREQDRWLGALWLECLAHAARHPEFRSVAATFWKGNRALLTDQTEQALAQAQRPPPAAPRDIATALIALDIGLFVQHLVDPDEAPLTLYPQLYELLFGQFLQPTQNAAAPDDGGESTPQDAAQPTAPAKKSRGA